MRYTTDNPYGYWISRDDIIPVVEEECHAEVALEILGDDFSWGNSIYGSMFIRDYVRVVNYRDGGYGVQYWQDANLSKLQKEFIKDAENVDLWRV